MQVEIQRPDFKLCHYRKRKKIGNLSCGFLKKTANLQLARAPSGAASQLTQSLTGTCLRFATAEYGHSELDHNEGGCGAADPRVSKGKNRRE
jgi:hypothetical protein